MGARVALEQVRHGLEGPLQLGVQALDARLRGRVVGTQPEAVQCQSVQHL